MKKIALMLATVLFAVLMFTGTPGAEEVPQDTITSKVYDLTSIVGPNTVKVPILGWSVSYKEDPFNYIADDLLTVEDVIDLIYNETNPVNWGPESGSFIAPIGANRISVRNKPAVLTQVDGIYGRLAPRKESYAVDIAIFSAEKVAPEKVIDLTDAVYTTFSEAVKGMTDAGCLRSFLASSNIRPFRTSVLGEVLKKKYIAEYSARLAPMAVGYESITDTIAYGNIFVLKPAETMRGVSLYVNLDSWVLDQIVQIETPGGILEKPELSNYISENIFEFAGRSLAKTHYTMGGKDVFLLISLK